MLPTFSCAYRATPARAMKAAVLRATRIGAHPPRIQIAIEQGYSAHTLASTSSSKARRVLAEGEVACFERANYGSYGRM
jgi:hypothetical protein